MSIDTRTVNGNTNGTNETANSHDNYSIPKEAAKLFRNGILGNPLIAKDLPPEAGQCATRIRFEGSDKPSVPINWRFAESVSALKALEATILSVLLLRKYGVEPARVEINTDHAQLFLMSILLWNIDPDGKNLTATSSLTPKGLTQIEKLFPSWDRHRQQAGYHRIATTNIYKTKDDRFFHLHVSALPHDREANSFEESWKPFEERISQITAEEMQHLATDVYKQAGTICWTRDEYFQSEHGKANAHIGLYEIHTQANSSQKPCWWSSTAQTSAKRPLAGLKVVDLTRVIAAPAITRGLAELGASVMRVTAPHLADFSSLHIDLNWGKWNTCLDFRQDADREKMRALILEADAVVQGYRPGVLDKYGFGIEGILTLCEGRERGVVVVRENCYGWNGPWAGRSGWQQISDACCGVSMEFGRAMGNDEAVTPVFPNSDYCTGISGTVGVLNALLQRARDGGSFQVDVALNYYSQWLVSSCGTYPISVWQDVWKRNGSRVFRHYHNMLYTIPAFMGMLQEHSADKLFRPEFFERRKCKSIGHEVLTVKPILRFEGGEVDLGYNVGTRTNGIDMPRWPDDLMTEIVT